MSDDEYLEGEVFDGSLMNEDSLTISINLTNLKPDVLDILYGTDMRTIEGELAPNELTTGEIEGTIL